MAEVGPCLAGLAAGVEELYSFRDRFFEGRELSEAGGKAGEVTAMKEALLGQFAAQEAAAAGEDRAQYLYLRGRVVNITGDYRYRQRTSKSSTWAPFVYRASLHFHVPSILLPSADAEALLSKAVKLRPDLVEAWNELGECYMMKQVELLVLMVVVVSLLIATLQDWETARTCFEGALRHRKDKVIFILKFAIITETITILMSSLGWLHPRGLSDNKLRAMHIYLTPS